MKRWKLNISPRYSMGLAALLVIACLLVSIGMAWARYRTEVEGSVFFATREPVTVYLGKVVYTDSEETTAEDATEETTAEDATEETTAEDATEETTAEDATEETTAEDATEETTPEDATEATTPEDATEATTPEDATEETTPEDAAEGQFVQTDEGNWELNEDGKLHLKFAIANGTSETEYEKREQQFLIRFICSLGIQTAGEPISLTLSYPQEDTPEEDTPEEDAPEEDTPEEDTPEEPAQVKATAVRIVPGSLLYNTFGEGWVLSFLDEEGEELVWTLEGTEMTFIEMDVTMDEGTVADTSLLQLQIAGRYAGD